MSTTEVEATVSNVIGLKDATSYGVEIPGSDGKYMKHSFKKDLEFKIQRYSTETETIHKMKLFR